MNDPLPSFISKREILIIHKKESNCNELPLFYTFDFSQTKASKAYESSRSIHFDETIEGDQ